MERRYFFDFDNTLSIHLVEGFFDKQNPNYSVHLHEMRLSSPKIFYVKMFGGEERIEMIRKFLIQLKKNSILYILSFCNILEISNALNFVGLREYFHEIFDYGCIKSLTGSKMSFIEHFSSSEKLQNFIQWKHPVKNIFIDDNLNNFNYMGSIVDKRSKNLYLIICKQTKIYCYHTEITGLLEKDTKVLISI